jgi:methionyl aminopeptidase
MRVCRSGPEIAKIDASCRIVREILRELEPMVCQGTTTAELDDFAERRTLEEGARPAFKGYRGYPASLCVSINAEVVHGIPGSRALENGDLVSLDFGVVKDGYYGDSAVTYMVGEVNGTARRLVEVTRECLMRGIDQVRPGRRLSDIGRAVQDHAEAQGFGVVREFVGHAIGTRLHEDPQVPNFVGGDTPDMRILAGMVLALEPMITAGDFGVKVLDDGWTAVTQDGGLAAHWELCCVALPDGPQVLGGDGMAA